MQSIETTAKSRQEAIQKALDELGVELHEVEIEILDEGSRGLFGIGARDVKVRVTAPDAQGARPKSKRHDEGPGPRDRRPRSQERTGKLRPEAKKPGPEDKKPAPPAGREPAPERRAASPRDEDEAPAAPLTEDDLKRADALLGEIITRMGMQAKIAGKIAEDGGVWLNVDSEDSAILIGRKGQTREALQFLVNRMMQGGEIPTSRDRIVVDVEGYLERRRQRLEEMARSMAEKVKDTGRRIRLKPLASHERRIIHVTLQDDPDVETFSVGDSMERYVVIAPKEGVQPRRPAGGQPDQDRHRDQGKYPSRRRGPRSGPRPQRMTDRGPRRPEDRRPPQDRRGPQNRRAPQEHIPPPGEGTEGEPPHA